MMDPIRKVSLPLAAGKRKSPHIEKPVQISDIYERSTPPPEKKMKEITTSAAQAVTEAKGLGKLNHDYRARQDLASRDGTRYIYYEDARESGSNYLARIGRGGEILWETPTGTSGLHSLYADTDGNVYARSKERLLSLSPDGILRYSIEIPDDFMGHWVDRSGNSLLFDTKSQKMVAFDKDGRKKRLPPGIRNLAGTEIEMGNDGTFYLRDEATITRFDLEAGDILGTYKMKFPKPPPDSKKTSTSIDEHYPATGGRLLVRIRDNYYIPAPPRFDHDIHFGLGFGRPFGMPHLPPEDRWYQGTNFSTFYLTLLDPDGKVVWKTGELNSEPNIVLTPQASVLYSTNSKKDNGKYEIDIVLPSGETQHFADVEDCVQKMVLRQNDGHLFVQQSNGNLVELDSSGRTVRSQKIEKNQEILHLWGIDDQGLLLSNEKETVLYSYDPDAGGILPLTDTERDHSYKVITKAVQEQARRDAQETSKISSIEKDEEWIIIAGVKLPRNRVNSSSTSG